MAWYDKPLSWGKKAVTEYNPVAGAIRGGYDLSQGNFGDAFGDLMKGTVGGFIGPLAAATGGDLIETGATKLGEAFTKPHDIMEDANREAGEKIQEAAGTAAEMTDAGTNRALDQTTPAGRQWQKTYEDGGALSGATESQKFYEDRKNGLTGGLGLAQQRQSKAINDEFAARNMAGTGAAIRAQMDLGEGIEAQNEKNLAGYAGQADQQQESRFGGAFDRLNQYGAGRAGVVERGEGRGVDAYTAGEMAKVNGDLGAAQAQAGKYSDILGAATGLGGTIVGGLVGGPAGAAMGSQLGAALNPVQQPQAAAPGAPKPAPKPKPAMGSPAYNPFDNNQMYT